MNLFNTTQFSESIDKQDLIDFDVNSFNYRYKFILLNNTYLESTNSFLTTVKWIKYLFQYKPDIINLTGYPI